MGASAVFVMIMALIRIKFISVTIGVIGIGVMANLNALLSTLSTIFGMGIHQRVVRDIAIDYKSNDHTFLAKRTYVLKLLSFFLGIAGILTLLLSSETISVLVFGDITQKFNIKIISIAILFIVLNNSYISIIQGVRKIQYLAYANISGSLLGTLIALCCFIFLGIDGIAWALVAIAITQTLATGCFVNNLKLKSLSFKNIEKLKIAWSFLKDGSPLMLSNLIATSSSLLIIIIITRKLGLESAGFYSAAFSLSVFFVNFVLTSMSSDYYPRLSSANKNKDQMNHMVNEQTEVGLHLTLPGLMICLVLAPFLVKLFYSGEFLPASQLLQWFILGCFGRVISWPMGFIILAQGKSKIFLFSELTSNVLHLGLVWYAVNYLSLAGTSLAFFLTYFFYTILMLFITNQLTKFKWESKIIKLIAISFIQFILLIIIVLYFNNWVGIFLTVLLISFSLIKSIKEIMIVIDYENKTLKKILDFHIIKLLIK